MVKENEFSILEDSTEWKRRLFSCINDFPQSIDITIPSGPLRINQGVIEFTANCGFEIPLSNGERGCKVEAFLDCSVAVYKEYSKFSISTMPMNLRFNEFYCRHIAGDDPKNIGKTVDIVKCASNFSPLRTYQDHLMEIEPSSSLFGTNKVCVNLKLIT